MSCGNTPADGPTAGAEVPAEFEAENALLCPDLGGDAPLPPDTERSGGLLVRRVSG